MTFAALLRLARPYRAALAVVTGLMLAQSLIGLLLPWAAGWLAGDILAGITDNLLLISVGLIGALAAMVALRVRSDILAGQIGLDILTQLRGRVHDHILALPFSFHQAARQGDTLSLMTWEVGRLADFLTGTLPAILPNLVTAIGAVILMALIDPVLALVVPALVPVFFLVVKVLGRRLRGLSARAQAAEAATMATAEQTLAMMPAIKTFTREAATAARWRDELAQARSAMLAEMSAHYLLGGATRFVSGAAAVVLLALAGGQLANGAMEPGQIVAFMLYAAALTRPVSALADVWGRVQVARGTLERLGSVLDLPPEAGGTTPIDRAEGAITLTGLSFAWPGRPPLLRSLDLAIAPGEIVALTGANGAGKSTLTALLMGLMSPDAGVIRLDGHDIATLRLPDLRRQFGHVPQRPLLFNGTIRDNIAFGRPGATEAQVTAAARSAQADAFIAALPQGYDTLIGDHGMRLSGGQGQRVALARALIKDPPVLILDEATAMYDLEGESAFVAAAATALKGRTAILITHRPATLALAHRILRLQDGALVPG